MNQAPLDAPVASSPPTSPSLRLCLLLQACCFPLLFGFYYLEYWNNVLVALFGIAFLLLIELATTPKTVVTTPLHPFGYLVVLFLIMAIGIEVVGIFWESSSLIMGGSLSVAGLYFLIWMLYPSSSPSSIPIMRVGLGACLLLFCWGLFSAHMATGIYLFWLRLSLVATLVCLLFILSIYWIVPKEKQPSIIDEATWLRIPQLLHIVLGMGITYYQYGPAFLI